MIPIDSWLTRHVAATATTIKKMAPRRSSHGARLKNIHQTKIARTQRNPPNIATR